MRSHLHQVCRERRFPSNLERVDHNIPRCFHLWESSRRRCSSTAMQLADGRRLDYCPLQSVSSGPHYQGVSLGGRLAARASVKNMYIHTHRPQTPQQEASSSLLKRKSPLDSRQRFRVSNISARIWRAHILTSILQPKSNPAMFTPAVRCWYLATSILPRLEWETNHIWSIPQKQCLLERQRDRDWTSSWIEQGRSLAKEWKDKKGNVVC